MPQSKKTCFGADYFEDGAKWLQRMRDFQYQNVRGYHFDEKVEFLDRRDQRFDAGLTGLAGVGWKLTPLVEVRLEGVCWYSLIDTASRTPDNVAPRYNTTWALRLGCAFHFGGGK